MKKEELHIPDSLKQGLENHMVHEAPDDMIDNVLKSVSQRSTQTTTQFQGYFYIKLSSFFIIVLASIWVFVPQAQSMVFSWLETFSIPSANLEFEIPIVFWWSMLAVAGLVYFDVLIQKFHRKKQVRA